MGFLADDDSTFKVCEDYMIYHIKKNSLGHIVN